MRKKNGKLYKVGTGLQVVLPAEWTKELNITEKSDIEKILLNGLIIISPKKLSDKKIKETINGLEPKKKVVLDAPSSTLSIFSSRKVATDSQEEYKTGLRQVLDINFTHEERMVIKTAFLFAEKEGFRVPEENSNNQEILGLLERAFNKCTLPGELSGEVQKILKKYGK